MTAADGWAVEILGRPLEIDELRTELRLPHSPWIEDGKAGEEIIVLLRSVDWEKLGTTDVIASAARQLVSRINAAISMRQPEARAIECGRLFYYNAGEITLPTITARVVIKEGSDYAGSYFKLDYADGTVSPMQKTLADAAADPTLSDMLAFLSDADDWAILYKAMETIERLANGKMNIEKLESRWGDIRQTANRHRHAPNSKFPMPKDPPSFNEARRQVLAVAKLIT
jgi:hypothetical protein